MSQATLLQIAQEFCERVGIGSPAACYAANDAGVKQVRRLLEAGCIDIAQRGPWEQLTNEATHTTLATEDQGFIATIASNGFDYWIPNTFWDRTNRLRLFSPTSSQDWQQYKALAITGPRYNIRVRKGKLLVAPAPTAGWTWAFEYISENWILNETTYRNRFGADDDVILLPRNIVVADLEWRWRKAKGLSYAEDFNTAERLITNAIGRSGGRKILDMGDGCGDARPGVMVPSGSWNV